MTMWQWIVIVVLVVLGVYLLVFHTPPFPGNHEDVGLGKLHLLHAIVGIVFLIGAFWIIRRARSPAPAA